MKDFLSTLILTFVLPASENFWKLVFVNKLVYAMPNNLETVVHNRSNITGVEDGLNKTSDILTEKNGTGLTIPKEIPQDRPTQQDRPTKISTNKPNIVQAASIFNHGSITNKSRLEKVGRRLRINFEEYRHILSNRNNDANIFNINSNDPSTTPPNNQNNGINDGATDAPAGSAPIMPDDSSAPDLAYPTDIAPDNLVNGTAGGVTSVAPPETSSVISYDPQGDVATNAPEVVATDTPSDIATNPIVETDAPAVISSNAPIVSASDAHYLTDTSPMPLNESNSINITPFSVNKNNDFVPVSSDGYNWTELSLDILCRMQPTGYNCLNKGTLSKFTYSVQHETCITAKIGIRCRSRSINAFDNLETCIDDCDDSVLGYDPTPTFAKMTPELFCRLQPLFGYCNDYYPRFYYDVKERTCRGFAYSGCKGNPNRFDTFDECNSTCFGKVTYN